MEKIKGKILKELFINDAFVHYFLWPLILLSILSFLNLPQYLKVILMFFFGTVSIICFPFALYRINNALYLVKFGIEIIVKKTSFEHVIFGTKLKFEYEYAGMKYNKTKFFQTFWFPDKESSQMKLLIDPNKPSNYAILELKKRSVITLIKNRFFLLASLLLLNTGISFGDDSVCSYFYPSLSQLPHTQLTQNNNDFESLWNGQRSQGCEIVYESHESLVSGSKAYDQFESLIHTPGWSINNSLAADGPGSSTVGIENENNRCLINWSQHAWIDEKTKEHRQSSQIKLVVQCSPK